MPKPTKVIQGLRTILKAKCHRRNHFAKVCKKSLSYSGERKSAKILQKDSDEEGEDDEISKAIIRDNSGLSRKR